ncbi:MAG: metallophosphoesterase family protein [Desulfuromonadaceae bacterium]
MKLAWLTDIHLNFVDCRAVEELCAAICASGAAAVLITGDIATSVYLCSSLKLLADNLKRPIYFVLGNHDYYGSSIRKVNADVEYIAEKHPNLIWLSRSEVVELSPDTCLIGHEGLVDGRLGDPEGSQVVLNDYIHIEELRQPTKKRRLEVQGMLGDEAARHLNKQLAAAGKYKKIIVALHAPPFAEACWHLGKLTTDEYLPHFACKATGMVLKSFMKKNPQVSMAVYCGHTHSSGYAEILPNLFVFTAAAEYRFPCIADILE